VTDRPGAAATSRLDAELVRRGLARSRGQARELVADGGVRLGGKPATKPSTLVPAGMPIELAAAPDHWVGRAAYKLLHALEVFGAEGLAVTGRRCLDVGASTGGFTQVLLEAGASSVTALDVGHGQLATRLASDPRVDERSGTNIRQVTAAELGGPFDVVVVDLSFISLRLVLDRIREQLADDGDVVLLVKPQFEVGREHLARTGVVRSERERRRVLDATVLAVEAAGLGPRGLTRSPLAGSEGNQEYLLWAAPAAAAHVDRQALSTMIESALAIPKERL
jgi:23S rRNA (cytidine1920-2'-O)/16S rRNA (cytidine1409-2'-O)-methyltransferase